MQISRRLARRVNRDLAGGRWGFVQIAIAAYIYLLEHLPPGDSSLFAKELICSRVAKPVHFYSAALPCTGGGEPYPSGGFPYSLVSLWPYRLCCTSACKGAHFHNENSVICLEASLLCSIAETDSKYRSRISLSGSLSSPRAPRQAVLLPQERKLYPIKVMFVT